MTANTRKSRIIIIGGNFAGLTAASKLSKHHEVTVIDLKPEFEWTPNIHEILSEVKKEASLSINLATIISRLGHRFIKQAVSSIDANLQIVTLKDKQILHYDVLLIASGHTRANHGIKGAEKYACGFRTAENVIDIGKRIEAIQNNNNKPININIVGSGFTGVEVLGELLRKYAHNKQMHFGVIDSASRLAQTLPEKLSDDILRQCKNLQVSFHFQRTITEVDKSYIHFSDNEPLLSDLTIWTAGAKLPDYVASLNTPIVNNGVAVNTYLQTQEFDNIFVAGDSASLTKSASKQASIAIDMGEHAAMNITRWCSNKTLKPFKVCTKPILLSLGDINTYYIQGNLVLASPMLAAAKEAVYQLSMARLSTLLPLDQSIVSVAGRITLSTEKLLLAEILKLRPRVLLGRSKVL